MSDEERKKLKTDIASYYGAKSKIAARAGVSHTLVYMVLNGDRNSDEVILAACEVLAEYREVQASYRMKQQAAMSKAESFANA